jgi:hypothetical protein
MKRSITLYPAFNVITESAAAGVLLSWLYWWFTHTPTKLRVQKRGKLWLAKSRMDIAEECGLSAQATRTAEAKLLAMGLVERVVWKFDAIPTNHYHLDVEKLARFVAPHKSGINKSITGVEDTSCLPPKKKLIHRLSDDFASQEETEESMAGKTAREVLEGIQKKAAASPTVQGKVQAKTLSTHWQRIVPKHFDVGFQKPHTMRELGMLSRYVKLTGAHALPAMEWALSNWAKFRYRAKEEMGEEVASKPTIPALLKCCTVAVEGYLKVKEPVHSPEPVQMSAPTVEKPVLATKEEIEAMLKSMDKTDED